MAVLSNINVSSENIEKTNELVDRTKSDSIVQTHNPLLDTLLNLKISTALEKDIKIEAEIFYPSSEGIIIKNIDLICLFSNLLDNAIEAAEQVEDSERKIVLKVTPQYNLLYINLLNSKTGTVKTSLGKYKSTKANPEDHGLGTQIIDNIIQKYNGEITYKENDGTMNIEAIVPMTE